MPDALMKAGLQIFHAVGYEAATVEQVRRKAGVSNGSFFHFFPTKRALAAAIFIQTLRSYQSAMLAALADNPSAREGVRGLISAHIRWVVARRSEANFLFEQSRAEWITDARKEQRAANQQWREGLEAWCVPLVKAGQLRRLSPEVFVSQIIGPAQIFCRGWLSGRDSADPMSRAAELADCAARAVLTKSALGRVAD